MAIRSFGTLFSAEVLRNVESLMGRTPLFSTVVLVPFVKARIIALDYMELSGTVARALPGRLVRHRSCRAP
jgi:hypothetical protein